MSRPLAIDLYCGLGGWAEGLLAEGWDIIGFDIERHEYGEHRYPAQLALQDVTTLHGSQFRDAALIVASPPCQFFSYCAMPWTRAKELAASVRADPVRLEKELALFEACFRIRREACEAAGRHIPLIVENVCGAQKWVGRARWNFGSFYLWGDVVLDRAILHNTTSGHGQNPGRKVPGIELGSMGFNVAAARRYAHMVEGVKIKRTGEDKRQHIGASRKFASAMIAKIPLPLSRHIAATFRS